VSEASTRTAAAVSGGNAERWPATLVRSKARFDDIDRGFADRRLMANEDRLATHRNDHHLLFLLDGKIAAS